MKWFDEEPTIIFTPHSGAPNTSIITNIKLAKDCIPKWLQNQKVYESKDKFVNCPGMDDLFRAGYIIPAWTDIRIKANKAGTIVKLERSYVGEPHPMASKVVLDVIDIDENVKFMPMKISSPWAIFAKSGYSAHVLPATFHSPFLRDLFVYPGIVDYDNFASINFMFCALRECEIFIPAGTPLLQVIPYKREIITGEVVPRREKYVDKHNFNFPTRVRAAYRKFFHKKKVYKLLNRESE